MMDPHTSQIHSHLVELERIGEELIIDRRTIVDLDRKRNDNRVALRQIIKNSDSDQQWIAMGTTFFRFDTERTTTIIQQEQMETEEKINTLRDQVKKKYKDLQDIEGKASLKGLDLKPLNKEVEALLPNKVFYN